MELLTFQNTYTHTQLKGCTDVSVTVHSTFSSTEPPDLAPKVQVSQIREQSRK